MITINIKKYYFEFILVIILAFMYFLYIPGWFSEWVALDSPLAFGIFMFAFIAYLLKKDFKNIAEIPKKPSMYCFIVSLTGLVFYTVGVRTDVAYLVCMSLPIFISGIILGLYGTNVLRRTLFPLILFTFTLPIFPIHRITIPMQLLSAKLTVGFLNVLGVPAYNDGTVINANNYKLSVEAACSGLRSLTSLFFTSIIFSYFIQANKMKKTVFVLLSIPLAVLMNIVRLTLVSFYAVYNGYKGLQEFHDLLGIILFIVSLGILIFISKFIENKEEEYYEA